MTLYLIVIKNRHHFILFVWLEFTTAPPHKYHFSLQKHIIVRILSRVSG